MASNFRFAAVLSLVVSTVSAYGIGERQPTKTVNYGAPHLVVKPTEAPSWDIFHDLLKLKPRVVTTICSEWTLLGGGQPACTDSSTCLFDTISGYGYEACALTSSSYYQVTECWNYPQTYVVSPVGQIFCGAAEPYCGYFEFVFNNGDVYSNFGCSTSSYSSTATLLPSAMSSYTPEITDSVITTTAGTVSETPTQLIVFVTPTTTQSSVVTTGSKKKSTPIGAIVGGVIVGIAAIATIVAIVGCLMYKKHKARKQREAEAAAATAAAFQASQNNNTNNPNNSNNRYSELGGIGKPPMVVNNGGPPPGAVVYTNEKPGLAAQSQELNYNQQQPTSQIPLTPQSPPPVYHQPVIPSVQYQELSEESRPNARSPVSAIYTGSSVASLSSRPHNATELNGTGYQWSGTTPTMGGGSQQHAELPSTPRPQHVDMSGAPMSESYHELQ